MSFKGEGIGFLSPTNKRDGSNITAGLGWLGTRAAPSIRGKARTSTRHPVHAGLHQLHKEDREQLAQAGRGPRGPGS